MPMCVIVTRDVPSRFRGFLGSCMLEIAPGVYTQPDMSAAVRERAWGHSLRMTLAFPPHARGWTAILLEDETGLPVSPARAGMDPR